MTKLQVGTVLAGVVLFLGLYLGFDTKPSGQSAAEKPAAPATETDGTAKAILEMARQQITAGDAAELSKMETALEKASGAEKIDLLKRISGYWYAAGDLSAAGIWAEKAAALEQTDTAWQVCGATFYQALAGTEVPELRQFCGNHAVQAFENAVSLNPGQVEHRVNLALVYAEYPPADNPMKAVQLLKELEAAHPDNAAVYNALGRLAIKTGQWVRAVERLEKALSLDPENPNTPCLLAAAYRGAGNAAKAKEYDEKCR